MEKTNWVVEWMKKQSPYTISRLCNVIMMMMISLFQILIFTVLIVLFATAITMPYKAILISVMILNITLIILDRFLFGIYGCFHERKRVPLELGSEECGYEL